MNLIQAYLSKPKTQQALSLKPGDDGFSLIELVVVVAVLAVLAAIAIPQFSGLSDDARLSGTKSILTNIYKECEFSKVRDGTAAHTTQVNENPNGVFWKGDAANTNCANYAVAKLGTNFGSGTAGCIIAIDLADGDTFYDNLDDALADDAGGWSTGWPKNFTSCT